MEDIEWPPEDAKDILQGSSIKYKKNTKEITTRALF